MQLNTSVSFTTCLQTGHISCGMGLECEIIALCVMFAVKVISIRLYPEHRCADLPVYRPRRRMRPSSEDNRWEFRKFRYWCDISLRLTASVVGAFQTNSWRRPLGSTFRGDIRVDCPSEVGEHGTRSLESSSSNRFSGRSLTWVSNSSA